MPFALVLGAGIAGSSAAIALRRIGYDVSVAEAQPTSSDGGVWLTLQSNGLAALDLLGVLEPVRGAGIATPSIDLTSATGRVLGTVPLGPARPDGTPPLSIARSDLHGILHRAATAAGAELVHDRRLVRLSADGGRPVAVFADGTEQAADVVVGADGLRSAVRAQLSPRNPAARYLPLLNLGGFSDPLHLDAPRERLHMVFGRAAFFGYALAPDGRVWWFANTPRPDEPAPGELTRVTDGQWRTELRRLFAADASPAVEIIDATPGALRAWTTYDVGHVPVWHDGAVGVIGDAAHAVAPSSGQGASMALEDAVVLAKCLRDVGSVPAAWSHYESLRRHRVEKIVAAGRRTSSTKIAGPVGRRLMDAVMPIVLRRLGRDGAGGQAWIYDYELDWDAPVHA